MTEPISIFDLKRATKDVVLNGEDKSLKVSGLTAQMICDHLERFPALATLSMGNTMTPMEAITATPGVTTAWVASALGHHNDPAAEVAVSENLTIEDTAFIIEQSLLLTFSRGFGPFAARLGVLLRHLTVVPGRDQDTRSRTRSPPPPPPPPPPGRAGSPSGLGIVHPDSSAPSSSSPSEDASSEPPATSPQLPLEPAEAPTP